MFLSKYGVARDIIIPIPKAGSADFAIGADWSPAAGDVKISKDGGAAANVTNLPTAITMGNGAVWKFQLTADEMQAAQVVVTVVDSATKAVDDQAFIVETYGDSSGQHALDLDTTVDTAVWSKAMSELSSVPGVTGSVLQALEWLFVLARNKREQTSTEETLYKDDGTTEIATAGKTDDGVTMTRSEYS